MAICNYVRGKKQALKCDFALILKALWKIPSYIQWEMRVVQAIAWHTTTITGVDAPAAHGSGWSFSTRLVVLSGRVGDAGP